MVLVLVLVFRVFPGPSFFCSLVYISFAWGVCVWELLLLLYLMILTFRWMLDVCPVNGDRIRLRSCTFEVRGCVWEWAV